KLSALDVAVHAVSLMEDDENFNAGKGGVFTREGRVECEASVMVCGAEGAVWSPAGKEDGGKKVLHKCTKRGVGVAGLRHVRNPVKLARELLVREADDRGEGWQAARHNFVGGGGAEKLAGLWGVELVEEGYFWTERRWKEHLRGLEREREEEGWGQGQGDGLRPEPQLLPPKYEDIMREPEEYLGPQGTVGCAVMDWEGNLAVATSTGGLTNKISGRIGDTPTLGAGFWAEEWMDDSSLPSSSELPSPGLSHSSSKPSSPESLLSSFFTSCIPFLPTPQIKYTPLFPSSYSSSHYPPPARCHLTALSGTGNGDFFLRFQTCTRIISLTHLHSLPLSLSSRKVLEQMRQSETGSAKGDAGVIGIDVVRNEKEVKGEIVMEMNCGGMFRGFVDGEGRTRVAVFRDEVPY
ncbi:MAG: hypothetical protein L6R37_007026, partial [Teloschistes peruensis]